LKQPTSSFWPVFSSVSSVGEYLSFGNHIICPLHVSRINAILGCKRHFHRRMKNNSGQECRLLRRHTRDRLWSATAPQGDRRLVEVSSRTSLCLRKMNSEAMARQSLISNASPAERRDMPNSHTVLGHMRGGCWRFIQDCSTNTQLTEEFGPKCGAFVALAAALINAVAKFLNCGTPYKTLL
jgi:hypothetical protein